MSADLFAVFGDLSQTGPQQNQNQNEQAPSISNTIPTATAQDPFSLLASSTPAPQHTNSQRYSQPLPSQPTTTRSNSPPKSSTWGDLGSLGGQGAFQSQPVPLPFSQEPAQDDDDDGWGDFVAPVNSPPQPPPQNTVAAPPRARPARASTIDMMTNKLVDLGLETPAPEPWQQRPSWEKEAKAEQPKKPAHKPDPNVLFDADIEAENELDEDDDFGEDDFGEFETGTPATSVPPAPAAAPETSAFDLLSLDSTPAQPKRQPPGLSLSKAAFPTDPKSYPAPPKSPYGSFQDRKPAPVKQLQVNPPAAGIPKDASQASPSPVTAWPAVEADGFGSQWEEFKDLPDTKPAVLKPEPKSRSKPAPAPTPGPSDWDWQDWTATEDQPGGTTTTASSLPAAAATEEKPGPPPTNIPPPAILLSLFPQLLDLASASLLKPLLTLGPSSPAYQRVLSAEPTLTFLRGYLALAAVAARLIAGRKQRWHRDRFLAQGMSISAAAPAAAGGQRGMKLASLDRAQSAHEDREAAEVAAMWKRQVGRLRSVVAGVNAAHQAAGGASLRVPEVAVGLPVSTAKGVPTAPRACVVCGLKRDERVVKVDVGVEDSFGEWWVEFWGHRECRNFWLEHEQELRQR